MSLSLYLVCFCCPVYVTWTKIVYVLLKIWCQLIEYEQIEHTPPTIQNRLMLSGRSFCFDPRRWRQCTPTMSGNFVTHDRNVWPDSVKRTTVVGCGWHFLTNTQTIFCRTKDWIERDRADNFYYQHSRRKHCVSIVFFFLLFVLKLLSESLVCGHNTKNSEIIFIWNVLNVHTDSYTRKKNKQ